MHRYKLIMLLAMLSFAFASRAQIYIPDISFGNCGSSLFFLDEAGQSELKQVRLLPNGKIIQAGNFYKSGTDSASLLLFRHLANGKLDSAGFGTNGIFLGRNNLRSVLNSITVLPGGSIIAAGHQNNSIITANDIPAVYRLKEKGEFDSTFNGNGIVAMRFDDVSSGSLNQVIVLNDDKMVATGIARKNGNTGTNGIGLLKLKTDGRLDSLFGNLPAFPGRSLIAMDSVQDVQIVEMNNNLVLPFLRRNHLKDTLLIARVLANGNIDNSFGSNGVVNTGISSENLSAILLQNGKLLMGGTLNESGQSRRIQLLQYTNALVPDAAFGTNGHVVLPTIGEPGNDNVLRRIVQLADGNLLVIGYTAPPSEPANIRPFVLRVLENGNLDSSFNNNGVLPINSEFLAGWSGLAAADTSGILVSRNPGFELLKYVPNNTSFPNFATAAFDYAMDRLNIFFNERSVNGQYFYWDFGDGQFSQQENPSHQYAIPGSYLVTLSVSGFCNSQTVSKRIEVRGIHKILPSTAPNRGLTLTRIYGYGFDNTSTVYLKKASDSIAANDIFFDAASQILQANFRFIGASPGVYDVIVSTGSRNDTLNQSFEIQPTEIGKPWVQLVGPYNQFFRASAGERVNTYRLEYGVTGNATQYLIPLSLVVRGTDLNVKVLTNISNSGDTTALPDSMKPASNGCYRYFDELNNDSVWVFYALDEVVEAKTTHVFEFQVISKTVMGDFGVYGYIGKSIFDPLQLDTLYSRPASGSFCSNACISCLFNLAGFVPGPIGCFASVVSTGCAVSNFASSPMSVGSMFNSMLNLAINFASTGISCGTMTGTTFGTLMQAVQKSLFGYTLNAASTGSSVIDCATAALNLISTGSCGGSSGQTGGNFKRTGSFDPNIKLGPASYNTRQYIAAKEPLNYTVQFENLAAATAPAYRVLVSDTINKAVLDIASFQFSAVGIANNTYPVFTAKDSFIMDIPIAGRDVVCRVKGNVDTSTGIVTWLFTSLESSTMELITDQANGFLPPNIDSITGKGFVSFTIGQKNTNTHLTAVSNKANIIFDFNAPIITPLWTNIVDTVKPQSRVLDQFRVLTDSTFTVKWTGFDADAGVMSYKIYVAENNMPYYLLGIYGKDSTVIKGTPGTVYKFVSIAIDSVNNIEEPPANAINNPDAIFTFSSPLPVQLVSFSAFKENESVWLKWSAASEINSSHFIIEHSLNGNNFTQLGSVRATGNSTVQTDYRYEHQWPAKGANYYRLKIVDRDGKFVYSPVRRLQFDRRSTITILPNPAIHTVSIHVGEPGGTLRLMGSTGQIIKKMRMTQGNTVIDVSSLAPGIYIATYLTPSHQVWSEKVLIKRDY